MAALSLQVPELPKLHVSPLDVLGFLLHNPPITLFAAFAVAYLVSLDSKTVLVPLHFLLAQGSGLFLLLRTAVLAKLTEAITHGEGAVCMQQVPRLTRALLRFLIVPTAVVLLLAVVVENPRTAGGAATAVFSCAPPISI